MSFVNTKRSGRPPGREFSETVAIRLRPDQVAALDRWIDAQPKPKPSRSEAIRRLLTATLDPKDKSAR